MSVALRARSMGDGRGSAAAGCAGEEDDAVRVARNLVEGLDHLGLAATRRTRERDSGPEAGVELCAEGVDQLALLLTDLGIAFGDEDLAVARLHAEELHTGDYGKAGERSTSPNTSTGPAPSPT